MYKASGRVVSVITDCVSKKKNRSTQERVRSACYVSSTYCPWSQMVCHHDAAGVKGCVWNNGLFLSSNEWNLLGTVDITLDRYLEYINEIHNRHNF